MDPKQTRLPFKARLSEIEADPEPFVDSVFTCLESDFLVKPKGEGFVNYPVFEQGYEALKQATDGFRRLDSARILQVALDTPISLVVLRAMLGFTPPEWAYVANTRTEKSITQGWIRTIDRNVRIAPLEPLRNSGVTAERLPALIEAACQLLQEGIGNVTDDRLHRLDKADTRAGASGVATLAKLGSPYAMLLYERFLGRPFASHRDSVSDIIGDSLESAIEDSLDKAGISFRKTKRAERIEGFDQTPDFIIPSEYNPQVVIEAKITQDGGTARDKVTRIQHLEAISRRHHEEGHPGFEVIACIGGRGFAERRQDMKKILLATAGNVFTAKTLEYLVEWTRLKEFKSHPRRIRNDE